MRSARPDGKRSASTTSADEANPNRSRFSWAQVTARGIDVRGHDPFDTAAQQHGGEHAGARAEVESRLAGARLNPVPTNISGRFGPGKWCLGDQIDVFSADRGEYTVARVDVGAEGGNGHALELPLVGAQHPVQLGQRDAHRSRRRAVGGLAGQTDIGGATQVQLVVTIEFDDECTEQTGSFGDEATLRFECSQCAEVTAIAGCRSRLPSRLSHLAAAATGFTVALETAVHRLQQLTTVMIVPAPQQPSPGSGQTVGGIGSDVVADHRHLRRGCGLVLRMPVADRWAPSSVHSSAVVEGSEAGHWGIAGRCHGTRLTPRAEESAALVPSSNHGVR